MAPPTDTSARVSIVITAVGPDNVRLADPIIHYVTLQGANITEIQMYDHDEEAVFAMMVRITLPAAQLSELRRELAEIGKISRDWQFAAPFGKRRRWRCCGRFGMGRFGRKRR
jgi:predicted amino acid-binding ACT domain protein